MAQRSSRIGALVLSVVSMCTFGAGKLTAQDLPRVIDAGAYRKGVNLTITARLSAPLPQKSSLLIVSLEQTSGKSYGNTNWIMRGSGLRYRVTGPALSPSGVGIGPGDELRIGFSVGGAAKTVLTASVIEGQPPVEVPTAPPAPTATPVPSPPRAVPTATPLPPAETPSPTPPPPTPVPTLEPTATAATLSAATPAQTLTPKASPSVVYSPSPRNTSVSSPVAVEETPSPVATPEPPAGSTPPAPVPASPAEETGSQPDGKPARVILIAAGLLMAVLGAGLLAKARSQKRKMEAEKASQAKDAAASNAPDGPTMTLSMPPAGTAPKSPSALKKPAGIRVDHVIAQGGFCDIVAIRRTGRPEVEALKILQPRFQSSAEARAAIAREGRLLELLNTKYPDEIFVRVIEQHALEDDHGELPYLILEYLEGNDLRHYVKQHGPLPLEETVTVMRDLATALACLHQEGYVHSDISPENVFRLHKPAQAGSRCSRFRLIDFGDAREHESAVRSLEITGKVAFISPEQATGFCATPQSDIYSLGMVLFFLQAGTPAFQSHNISEILKMHKSADIRFPANFPEPVQLLVKRLTAKLPLSRPISSETVKLIDRLSLELG